MHLVDHSQFLTLLQTPTLLYRRNMPEEGFYFLTHTPAQAKKWKDLCASDPERVARVLRLKHDDPPTSDGDNQRDVFPAIEALREISGGRAPDSPDPLWAPLVDSGVVVALCECVIVLITQLSPLPTLPEILRRKAANDVCFLYSLLPDILFLV